jgi:hypothetical protein
VIPVCLEPAVLRITTVLQPRGPAAAIVLSAEQLTSIAGTAKTPPVRVTVNGTTFEGRIGSMGGEILIGFNRSVREALGVAPGDTIDAEIVVDQQPRSIELPDALAEAFAADDALRVAFDALAPSRRKEIARSIADAKRPETAAKRLAQAVEQLRQ